MAFPSATGLTYADGAGNETLLLIRDDKFVTPNGGWDRSDRVYFVKEVERQVQPVVPTADHSMCFCY